MEQKLTTYVEFADANKAQEAVRALKAAGYEHIEIEDLDHGLQTSTDMSEAPSRATWTFGAVGVALGSILGCVWGLLVFGLPAEILKLPYALPLMIVGTLLCVGTGAVIGLEQAFVIVSRLYPDPTAVEGARVGVRVAAENGRLLIRAKEILAPFTETTPKQKNWWIQRRWAHQIGT